MQPIRTCVLGVGLSGLTFHVPFILALPELFTLHAVLERAPKSEGGKVKERFGADVKIYRDIDDILRDSEIELIIVGTPNETHYEYVKKSLEAGKHVLVDKPVLPTASEARELGRIAKSKNLVLYAYQNRRWDSDFLSLKRLLEEPATSPVFLGDIIEFESHYDRYRNELKGDWKEAHLPAAGIVYNLGSHIIDQVVSLLGRPEKVTGFVENIRELGHPDVDDSFMIVLQYPKSSERNYKMTAILRAHILSARDPQLRFLIRGTRGTFVKYGLDVQEDQLKIMHSPTGIFADEFGREPEKIWGEVEIIDEAGNVSKTLWPTNDKGAYIDLFRNLASCIRESQELKVNWDSEVVTVLEIIELAHRSSKEGRTLVLS